MPCLFGTHGDMAIFNRMADLLEMALLADRPLQTPQDMQGAGGASGGGEASQVEAEKSQWDKLPTEKWGQEQWTASPAHAPWQKRAGQRPIGVPASRAPLAHGHQGKGAAAARKQLPAKTPAARPPWHREAPRRGDGPVRAVKKEAPDRASPTRTRPAASSSSVQAEKMAKGVGLQAPTGEATGSSGEGSGSEGPLEKLEGVVLASTIFGGGLLDRGKPRSRSTSPSSSADAPSSPRARPRGASTSDRGHRPTGHRGRRRRHR